MSDDVAGSVARVERVLSAASRRTRNIEVMAEVCATEPTFNVAMLVEHGIATSSAYRLTDKLVSEGILRRERRIRGVDAWTVVPLTDALDEFARRAGRRTFNRG